MEISFHTTMVLTQQALRTLDHTAFSRFHTTMVLTQQPTKQVAFETPFHVSIPLWFLRNQKDNQRSRRCTSNVSIPLWFLRNQVQWIAIREKKRRFHTTMVLTQRAKKNVDELHSIMVLTQRTRLGTCRVCLYRFHTTMVHTRAVLR